ETTTPELGHDLGRHEQRSVGAHRARRKRDRPRHVRRRREHDVAGGHAVDVADLAAAAPFEQHGRHPRLLLQLRVAGLCGASAADMARSLATSQGYSESKGILPARRAVVQYHLGKGVEGIDVEDVWLGNGVSELITMTLQALLNDGDEVLIPAPDYPLWTAIT